MLVLFETPAGYAVFKLLKEKKLKEAENMYVDFETPEAASKIVKLVHFKKFKDTTEALQAATATIEGKLCKPLKKVLKKLVNTEVQEELAVSDTKLGNMIKDKLDLQCVHNTNIQELMRCIRSQRDNLIEGITEKEMSSFSLGLAHSLSRYKLKFSPDKVDIMIVQAIGMMDDLDKEINKYAMRAREWYGWHFPESMTIIDDNYLFAKAVRTMGHRVNLPKVELDMLPDEMEEELRAAAEISMGSEVSDYDMAMIQDLCDEIIELSDHRRNLVDYLTNRMSAIAPNLTVVVGHTVGARLIAHAGSLMNLAKQASSTVQILGAEKSLFNALKNKRDTPKYGLLYHANMVSNSKLKGKASRMVACKAALAIRIDALGEETSTDFIIDKKAKLEVQLMRLESGKQHRISGTAKGMATKDKYAGQSDVFSYDPAQDSTLSKGKKRKHPDPEDASVSKKQRKSIGGAEDQEMSEDIKRKVSESGDQSAKKKKKKVRTESLEKPVMLKEEIKSEPEDSLDTSTSEKKKKKKKKKKAKESEDSD